ncbi:MAG: ribonuclease D [Pseudomonadota bacterium]
MNALVIADAASLHAHCARWQTLSAIGIDTEFVRTRTYFAQPGLIQLSDPSGIYLVDPIAIENLGALNAILTSPSVVKVLHSAEEDLGLLSRLAGAPIGPIFDTQIAAAFLGFGFSVGYRTIVDACFNVTVEKGETRSDWMQRPLTASQLRYAAQDVEWLLPLYDKFTARLAQNERASWVREECIRLEGIGNTGGTYDLSRFRNAWQLDQINVAILARLIDWREQEARRADRPRGHVLSDDALYQVARFKRTHNLDASRLNPRDFRGLKRHRDAVGHIIEEISAAPAAHYPAPPPRPATSKSEKAAIKSLRSVCDEVAAELGIAPELLAQRRILEQWLRSIADNEPPALRDWQRPLLQTRIDEFAKAHAEGLANAPD